MRQIPAIFRIVFLRNLYGWAISLYFSRKYDYILLRYMTFDPFSFIFSPLIGNRISVHHAKEVEELKLVRRDWRGLFASALERRSGAFSLKRVRAIAAVTNEIANYQKARSKSLAKTILFENGVNSDCIENARDDRNPDKLNVAFICGTFSEWHGLDILIDRLEVYGSKIFVRVEKIHLIGNVLDQDMYRIKNNPFLRELFCIHGMLTEDNYRKLLDKCDIGLSSFSLNKKGLAEASTLKVRELLALGIPVYSGHIDCAVNGDFKYYRFDRDLNIESLVEFGFSMKKFLRSDVSSYSKKFIDKYFIMKRFIDSVFDL